jgi:hypothetical protein
MDQKEKRQKVYEAIVKLEKGDATDIAPLELDEESVAFGNEQNIVKLSGLPYPDVDAALKWLKRHDLIIPLRTLGVWEWLPKSHINISFMCWEHGKMMVPRGKGEKFRISCPSCKK